MVDAERPVLYSYWRSSCSYRVRIVLAWKNIPYEYRAIHLLKNGGEQLTDEYAEINPMKLVPALSIHGHTLTQSNAIIEYLEEVHPENPLLPKDPVTRATVRIICAIISNDIQPVANLRILKNVMALLPEDTPQADKEKTRDEWFHKFVSAGFNALEKVLEKSAGKYCVGDEVSIADIFLVPQVYNALRFNVDMTPYPLISRINEVLLELPAFASAHPSQQPDANT